MSSPPTRRRALVWLGLAAAGPAAARTPRKGTRAMFSAQTLAKADAARVFVAPPGLQTRTRLTPTTLMEVVAPRRITPADPAWAALAAALQHATVAAAPSEREVRLGVVLEAAGAPIGQAFLSQADAAQHDRVYAVVDGQPGSADAGLARAIAAAGA